MSLGAYLSLTNAMIDARVKAVAEYFGVASARGKSFLQAVR